ncbi:class A beta-lactamase-related serine hydrolase [Herbiconiux sp. CPCC 205763]|uniref:Class A beta-lactamase-related serine hydrolase n=1 Tax=Herbiconiux aconitum TaxID=2970913 RepID=A0ABT2GMK7_9MICO|nr:serine hydrolase [Herbiconiux aconitum]MCS5717472.1 class A beta-lactamase-related serine hydrolase [Herbiconiux aconitum]
MPESIRRRARSEREEIAPRGRRSDPIDGDGVIFRKGFASLTELALSGVQVTASALDAGTGKVLFSVDDHLSVPTASIGKVLLLIEVAARISARDGSGSGSVPPTPAVPGSGSADAPPRNVRPAPGAEALSILNRTAQDSVGDSGLWQHLQVPALPVSDLAALIGATSDNLATNVLLRRIGLDAVRARAESLGLRRTLLLDIVRDVRGPDDAPQLSVGSARELATLFRSLERGEVVDETTSRLVTGWLSLGSDLSMVAGAFGLDPFAHTGPDHGIQLFNKTGTDAGIRSEAGVVVGPRAGVAYAVTMRFNDVDLPARLGVLDAMRTLGTDFLEYVY